MYLFYFYLKQDDEENTQRRKVCIEQLLQLYRIIIIIITIIIMMKTTETYRDAICYNRQPVFLILENRIRNYSIQGFPKQIISTVFLFQKPYIKNFYIIGILICLHINRNAIALFLSPDFKTFNLSHSNKIQLKNCNYRNPA